MFKMLKTWKRFAAAGLAGPFLAGALLGIFPTAVFADGGTADIAVTEAALNSAVPLSSPYNVGVNLEMSMVSDEMWTDNGRWMEQSFSNSGIRIVRWGYDAWVFDWEREEPLLNNYQGGNNTKDGEGSYGLREFLRFCKRNGIIPLVDIPIETYDHRAGSAQTTGPESLELVKRLAKNMAVYLNESGFDEVYFDMGNEPWSSVSCQYGGIPAGAYGALFEDFYNIIKAVNPNYKLLLVHEGGAAAWNNAAEAAANGFYDGVDDHQYPRPNGWANYYARNDDKIFSNGVGGTTPADKIKIMGECNLPWPNFPAYGTNLGASLALLNGFLGLADDDYYHSIITWPSHWPTGATTANVGAASKPVGWFDTDAWYYDKKPVRLSGPAYAQMIAQSAVLDRKVAATSSNVKVRSFAYASDNKNTLKLVVLNKESLGQMTLNITIPAGYDTASAMVLYGERDAATASASESDTILYKNHFDGDIALTETTFRDVLAYGECAVVYTFSKDGSPQAPGAFDMTSPVENQEIGTAHTFIWSDSAQASNYRLTVSAHADMSSPAVDVYTGGTAHYQLPAELENNTTYYYRVTAVNKHGSTENQSGVLQCRTVPARLFINDSVTQSNEAGCWSYDAGWHSQTYRGCLKGDDHNSSTTGSAASFRFSGTQARIYGVKGSWCGMAEISVDGQPAETTDLYRPVPTAQAGSQPTQDMIFDTGALDAGTHTITIKVLSDKNPAVSGKAYIELDYAEVFDGQAAPDYHAKTPQLAADLPASLEKQAGDSLELSVQYISADSGALSYEWYRDDVLLAVTEDGVYRNESLDTVDAGEYYARVTNFVNGISKTVRSGICTVTVGSAEPGLQAVLEQAEQTGFCYIFNEGEADFDGNRIVDGTAQDIERLKASTGGTLLVRYCTEAAQDQVIFAAGKDYSADHYGAILANNTSGTQLQRIDFPDGMVANLRGMNTDGGWHTFVFSVDAADPTVREGKSVTSFDGSTSTQFPNFASWFNQNPGINDLQYLQIGGTNGAFAKSNNNTNFVGRIAFVAYTPTVFTQSQAARLSAEAWVLPPAEEPGEQGMAEEKAFSGEQAEVPDGEQAGSRNLPEPAADTLHNGAPEGPKRAATESADSAPFSAEEVKGEEGRPDQNKAAENGGEGAVG